MKRGKPPVRRKYLARGTRPIRARRANPKARRFAKHRCPEFIAWLREQPCHLTGERHLPVDPAHVKPRSLGGADLWNALPLAHHLHDELHSIGIKSWQRKYGVDLIAAAWAYTEAWLVEFPEFGGLRGSDPQ